MKWCHSDVCPPADLGNPSGEGCGRVLSRGGTSVIHPCLLRTCCGPDWQARPGCRDHLFHRGRTGAERQAEGSTAQPCGHVGTGARPCTAAGGQKRFGSGPAFREGSGKAPGIGVWASAPLPAPGTAKLRCPTETGVGPRGQERVGGSAPRSEERAPVFPMTHRRWNACPRCSCPVAQRAVSCANNKRPVPLTQAPAGPSACSRGSPADAGSSKGSSILSRSRASGRICITRTGRRTSVAGPAALPSASGLGPQDAPSASAFRSSEMGGAGLQDGGRGHHLQCRCCRVGGSFSLCT